MTCAPSRELSDAIAAARATSAAAARRWRETAEYRAATALFANLDDAAPETVADRAERLLSQRGWAEAIIAPLIENLSAQPLFEPSLRTNRDARRTGAILFEAPTISIAATVLCCNPADAVIEPATVIVSGRLSVTAYVRSGGAVARRWRVPPVTSDFSAAAAARAVPSGTVAIGDGQVLRLDGRVEGQIVVGAAADVASVSATIRSGATPLVREYRILDGTFVRAGCGDDRASRAEMLLAFLRVSGRVDAGACFEAASRDDAFHLRWAAMREWLALDAPAALPRLAEMAKIDPNGEVRAAAATTLARARLQTAV